MAFITTRAPNIHASVLFITMTEVLICVVAFFTATTASAVFRHMMSATPQVTVANLVTKGARYFILSVLHWTIT